MPRKRFAETRLSASLRGRPVKGQYPRGADYRRPEYRKRGLPRNQDHRGQEVRTLRRLRDGMCNELRRLRQTGEAPQRQQRLSDSIATLEDRIYALGGTP